MLKKDLEKEAKKDEWANMFVKNSPPTLRNAFKDYARESLVNSYRYLEESIEKVDIEAALYYIALLKHHIEMRYPIARKKRVRIAQICMTLLTDFAIDLPNQTQIIELMTDIIKRKNLMSDGLVIAWRPLYDLLKRVHFSATGTTPSDATSTVNRHGAKLLGLLSKARQYFERSSLKEILDELLPYLNPFDWYYSSAMDMLSILLPTKQGWVREELKQYQIPSCVDNNSTTRSCPT
ncbi:hypothetical protein RFI_24860 [Reticulomyxa filosa]|uniref:Uncharacterized protein n=1 Tax=Reticulomyxa filosa TaxID=46433 RepID=X6MFS3_RETFI|nr:hypothetical protein RFI_24860 [Reticulomyxa filosa]|eukprot:ETO12516.1 hypothetical protein RFI_24860 [Reticulomyxa filosa]